MPFDDPDLSSRINSLESRIASIPDPSSEIKSQIDSAKKEILSDVAKMIAGIQINIQGSGKIKVTGAFPNWTISIEDYSFTGSGTCVDGAIELTITAT